MCKEVLNYAFPYHLSPGTSFSLSLKKKNTLQSTLSACTISNIIIFKKKGINWTTLIFIKIVICSIKGFLSALSELVHMQMRLLFRLPWEFVTSLKTLWKIIEYVISQNRKKVPFPFICNQLR